MKTISLTQGKVAIVDAADYKWLNQWKWRAYRGNSSYTFYAVRWTPKIKHKRSLEFMHRLILGLHNTDDTHSDHINGDGLDNRRANLRLCNHCENMRNRRINSNNKAGFKGVHIYKIDCNKPYRAQIKVNNRKVHIGHYETAEAAARAYDVAALKHHGRFASTNAMLGLL